mgnify:CR=1 FL=1
MKLIVNDAEIQSALSGSAHLYESSQDPQVQAREVSQLLKEKGIPAVVQVKKAENSLVVKRILRD